jgi:hypothetical protein
MYVLLGPVLETQKKNIFDVLMAFCAASSGAFIGGTAAASGEIPFLKDSPFRVSAAAALASLLSRFYFYTYRLFRQRLRKLPHP